MTPDKRSTLLGRLTAASFTLNAILHTAGYSTATNMAGGDADLRAMVAVLWLAFGAGAISLALIALASARAPRPSRRNVYLLAAIFPLATSILMLSFMGYMFPVALLGITGALAIATGVTSPASDVTTHA
ncbi:MAG: hypothetical protein ACREOK_03620 [Gemmatimonadaceae bacterium]